MIDVQRIQYELNISLINSSKTAIGLLCSFANKKTAALPLKALCLSHNAHGNCYEEIPGLDIAVASRKSTDLNMKQWKKNLCCQS